MDKMKDYIHTYMNQKDITLETKVVYLRILKYFHTYITNQCILKIDESTIKDYILHLHQKHYAPKWIYQHISILKGFFQYLDTHKTKLEIPSYIDTICAKNMKQVRAINQKHIHTLHPVESKAILNKLKENRRFIFGFRDYAIVLLMMTTGMRSIKIRRAHIKDLKNIEGKYLLYIQGKGQHVSDHMVHITPYVYENLKDYLLKRKDLSPYLFVTQGRRKKDSVLTKATLMAMFIRIEGVCGLSRGSLHGHMLRHTAANMYLSLTSNIEATQQFLRHKRTVTTYTYVNDHLNPEYANTLHDFILEESTFSFEDGFNKKKPSYKDHFLYPLTETYLKSLSIKKTSIKSYRIAYKKLLT
jgi:integrase